MIVLMKKQVCMLIKWMCLYFYVNMYLLIIKFLLVFRELDFIIAFSEQILFFVFLLLFFGIMSLWPH